MKRFLITISLLVGSITVLTGCKSVLEKEKEEPIDVLVSYAGSLVGDASSVVNIGYILPGGEDVKQVELQTDEQPNEINIVYGLKEESEREEEAFENDWSDMNTKRAFLYNAIAYFALVDNVDQVTFQTETDTPHSLTVTRADIEQFLGKDVRQYATDAEIWKTDVEEGIMLSDDKIEEFYAAYPLL